jgi:hypothetical protein
MVLRWIAAGMGEARPQALTPGGLDRGNGDHRHSPAPQRGLRARSHRQVGVGRTRDGGGPDCAAHGPAKRAATYELRRLRQQSQDTNWKPNDLNDIASLAVAIPYCDVVVTERQWSHMARRAELDRRFNTVILHDLRSLPRSSWLHELPVG